MFLSNPTFMKKNRRNHIFNYGIPEAESHAEQDDNSDNLNPIQAELMKNRSRSVEGLQDDIKAALGSLGSLSDDEETESEQIMASEEKNDIDTKITTPRFNDSYTSGANYKKKEGDDSISYTVTNNSVLNHRRGSSFFVNHHQTPLKTPLKCDSEYGRKSHKLSKVGYSDTMSVMDKRAALSLLHFKKKKTDTSKYSIKNLANKHNKSEIIPFSTIKKRSLINQSLIVETGGGSRLSKGSSSKNSFSIRTLKKSNANINAEPISK